MAYQVRIHEEARQTVLIFTDNLPSNYWQSPVTVKTVTGLLFLEVHMPRLMIRLEEDERAAIWTMAKRERRDPREQTALIVRRELEREGLLKPRTPEAVDGA